MAGALNTFEDVPSTMLANCRGASGLDRLDISKVPSNILCRPKYFFYFCVAMTPMEFLNRVLP